MSKILVFYMEFQKILMLVLVLDNPSTRVVLNPSTHARARVYTNPSTRARARLGLKFSCSTNTSQESLSFSIDFVLVLNLL